ncbi:TPA: hypothetical protein ACGUU0_003189 [Vibrio vulnificus]|uniref:hypothetical protein n=1 Tax=Vibrio parahaemolyticus TaxID=670 RepID=UPI000A884C11|nr:hypothetical protein [Vibrio parahaemolyticus]
MRQKQSGYMLIQAALLIALVGILLTQWVSQRSYDIEQELYGSEAKRFAEIAHAVIRYQASGGNVATGLLSPAKQFNVAGQPFYNGTVHVGLNWLKETSCDGPTTAPFELLPCEYSSIPLVGDLSQYRFTISNNGTDIVTTITINDANNPSQGIVIRGVLEPSVAASISAKAEPLVTYTSLGSVNTLFKPLPNAIPSVRIGSDISNMPWLVRTGEVTVTGDLHFENNAGIVFDTPADISGVDTIFARKLEASATKYLEPEGESKLHKLSADEATVTDLSSTTHTSTDMTATNLKASNAQVQYLEQTDSTLQNRFAGELRIGDNSNNTTIGQGHIFTSGNIYDANNSNFLLDISGTSRIWDVAIGNKNDALLSDRMPNFVLVGVRAVRGGESLPRPSCGASGSPRLILTPQRWSTLFLDDGNIRINNNVNYLSADLNGTNWVIRFLTHRVSDQELITDPNGVALAQIFCYYP